jgi:hypothetical protein
LLRGGALTDHDSIWFLWFGSEYQAIECQELSPQNSLMWYSLAESLWTWIEVAQLDTSSADAIEVMNTQRLVFASLSL